MAGANNAQMKAAGWRAADVTKARAIHGQLSHAVMEQAGYKPKAGYQSQTPSVKRNPALDRMQQAKANVPALRAARDERRVRMAGLRQRVEMTRETRRIEATLSSDDMRRAVDRAEDGYGPAQARRNAKGLLREARAVVKEARVYKQRTLGATSAAEEQMSLRLREARAAREAAKNPKWSHLRTSSFRSARENIARAREIKQGINSTRARHSEHVAGLLAKASQFRAAAAQERRHAMLVERADALREIVEERSPFQRAQAKKRTGFRADWLK